MTISIIDTPYVDVALEAARAAVAAAESRDMRIAVVVLDGTFTEVAVLRMDGAFASAVQVARAKAHTSVNFGAPTSAMAERVSPENKVALSTVEPRLMFVGGGVPLRSGDRLVGGLGVSGGSEPDDVAVAEAAMTSIAHLLGT
jgi:uncharacterized protein GlcG (DUF336 family)